QTAFTPGHVLSISEVGVPVADVSEAARFLGSNIGAAPYSTASDDFAALGNEHGLLIIVRTGRPWYPTEDILATGAPAAIQFEGHGTAIGKGVLVIPGSECRMEEVADAKAE